MDTADDLPEVSTRETEEAKISTWELDGLELELSVAMDPESFAAKVLNPKKRKPDSDTGGSGLPENPTAKRKPDGSPETSRGSPSASASASQGQPMIDLDLPLGSAGRSTPAVLTAERPHVRPTHTPVSAGEVQIQNSQEKGQPIRWLSVISTTNHHRKELKKRP